MEGKMKRREYATGKTEVLQLRLSPDLKKRIKETAKNRGLSISDVVRLGIELVEKEKTA